MFKKYISKTTHVLMVAVLCLGLQMGSAKQAFAQCEAPIEPWIAAAAFEAAQTAAVIAMTAAIEASYLVDITAAQAVGGLAITAMDVAIRNKLDWLWTQWEKAMKDQTKQLHSSAIDQTRQFAINYDTSDLNEAARTIQRAELEAKKEYRATNQACQFDTTARYLGRTLETSKAVTTGYALDLNRWGNAEVGTDASGGQLTMSQSRFAVYRNKFCDPNSNSGNAPCTAANPDANKHILPSKTIFSQETIDLTDATTRDAVTQLMLNVTGYRIPELSSIGALDGGIGKEQRQKNRRYLAQMDVVGALAYSLVGDRAPGQPAPEIQQMRVKVGVSNASATPSAREVRQAVVEQLWDPNYFKELGDSPNTLTQKELYLKAYNLVMMNQLVEKQERISNIYAMETANILDKNDHSRGTASRSAPF
jgi:hypothetical protein